MIMSTLFSTQQKCQPQYMKYYAVHYLAHNRSVSHSI